MPYCTRFVDGNGSDLGTQLVEKDYVISVYPQLAPTLKSSTLFGWGGGVVGRLGNISNIDRSSPVQTISGGTNWKQVSSGSVHAAAIKSDGTLWSWGSNAGGRLGDNSIVHRSSPVQTISGGTNWYQVSAGASHTVAIKCDGTLWAWGCNGQGELGTNNLTARSSPVQTIAGGNNWKQVSSEYDFNGAIKSDGTLWMWGDNLNGVLGTNDQIDRSSPVQTVAGGTNWKQVSVGGLFTGAIKTDGTLWMWGNGFGGRLGTNNQTCRSSPVQTISGGNNWKQVSLGQVHASAVKTDGTLWVWGLNCCGNLGTNNRTNRSSPVQTIYDWNNWRQVDSGGNLTTAVKTDGTLWAWGENGKGQLGDNTNIDRSVPVQTVTGGTNWKQVSTSIDTINTMTFGIREEGGW